MSFSETIFLFFLALLVFGPKKLPEIARQAGKFLAELRRASNEFKSQIESEIAHLEVEKRQNTIPPITPPVGAVASLSLNPTASEAAPQGSNATLAAPLADPILPPTPIKGNAASASPAAEESSAPPNPVLPTAEIAPTSQDSHA